MRKWIQLALLINILLFVFLVLNIDNLMLNLTVIIWTNMFIYCLADISERCQILVFLIAFFVFLIGRQILETYNIHVIESEFANDITLFSEKLVLISLASFSLFTVIFNKLKIRIIIVKPLRKEIDEGAIFNSSYYRTIRKYSKMGFYSTYLFGLYSIFQVVYFVVNNGYIAYYSSYVNHIPYVIEKLGEISVLFFWIFLATMPEKNKIIFPTFLFIVRSVITLGTGQRFEFVAVILTLIVYFAMRNSTNRGKDAWINKKSIVFLVIAAPLLVIAMTYYNYMRLGKSFDFEHISDIITDFLYRQGVTINVLKRYKLYESSLPTDKFYMFSKINNIIRNGPIGTLVGMEKFSGNSAEYATKGSSLAHALSFIVLKSRYLNGEGLGSSYIAETYHDMSYIGLVFINCFYAFMLCKVIKISRKSIWGCTFALTMLSAVLFAIRGETDGFMSIYLNISTWIIIIGLHILAKGSDIKYKDRFSLLTEEKMLKCNEY